MKTKPPNNVIGIFYQRPDKSIVRTIGITNKGKTISYYLEGGDTQEASDEEFQTWIPQPLLKDFPNSKDPALAYVFDLYWDIKHLSQLKKILESNHSDKKDIERMAEKYGYLKLIK